MGTEELTALALRSIAAGDAPDVIARALAIALSERVPRCLVGIGLGASVLEMARAGSSVAFPAQEYLRLVSTGQIPFSPTEIPPAHRNRWVEPLRGFLDPARYVASPVGRLMAAQGVFHFGRHFVCDGTRVVATVGAALPHGIDRFTDEELSVLAPSATALGPLLRLHAQASLGATFEAALLKDAERRGEAAFLVAPTGAVLAASPAGDALLAARPTVRAEIEQVGAGERLLTAQGLRLTVTSVPGEHHLVTATPLADDGAGSLTSRQNELLDYVENGLSNREIALVMGLSPATVKTMLQRLYERTETAGRMELVRWRRAGSR